MPVNQILHSEGGSRMYSSQVLLDSLTLTELLTAALHVRRGRDPLRTATSVLSVIFNLLGKRSESSVTDIARLHFVRALFVTVMAFRSFLMPVLSRLNIDAEARNNTMDQFSR